MPLSSRHRASSLASRSAASGSGHAEATCNFPDKHVMVTSVLSISVSWAVSHSSAPLVPLLLVHRTLQFDAGSQGRSLFLSPTSRFETPSQCGA
jgi:hypothetical protein